LLRITALLAADAANHSLLTNIPNINPIPPTAIAALPVQGTGERGAVLHPLGTISLACLTMLASAQMSGAAIPEKMRLPPVPNGE